MKLFYTVILSLFPLFLFSQFDGILKYGLKTNDTKAFDRLVDSLEKVSWNSFNIFWEVQRELVPNFRERILTIESPGITKGVHIKVNLISTDKEIVCYELFRSRKNSPFPPADSLLEKNQNDSLFKVLEFSFNRLFGGKLNKNGLFVDSVVYSTNLNHGCYGATATRNSISSLVDDKNIGKLSELLYSANVEKQLYAIEALYKLKSTGFKLSEQQVKYIKNVLTRKGNYRYCSNYVISQKEISGFLLDLAF